MTQTEKELSELTEDEVLQTEEDQEEKRRKRLLLLLSFLLMLLCLASSLFYRYLRQPAPLPELLIPQADFNYPPHYLFSIYGVEKPVGVTLSPQEDRIYVSESGGERMVRIFDRQGEAIGFLAPPRTRPGERSPVYVATDSQGRLFVSDRLQHTIFVFDEDGNYLDSLINSEMALSEYVSQHIGGLYLGTRFEYNVFQDSVYYQTASNSTDQTLPAPGISSGWSPLGVRIDDNDMVFVTNVTQDGNRVYEFSIPDELVLVSWHEINAQSNDYGASGQGNGEFLFPNAAMADSQGRVYVSDGNNGRISVWGAQNNFLFNFGGGGGEGALSLPRGMYIDERDRLYVVDAVGQDVKVYDVSGEEPAFLYQFGDFGLDDGLFNYPNDIVVDGNGRIYITDRENNRVQVWSY